MAAARSGHASAWAPLLTYAQELLHHETTALDLVQETFIAAHRHLA